MKILAGLIRRELQLQAGKYGHCAIYEDELQRIWSINEENRTAKIAQFAKENGFRSHQRQAERQLRFLGKIDVLKFR